jgi:hypothetical protein
MPQASNYMRNDMMFKDYPRLPTSLVSPAYRDYWLDFSGDKLVPYLDFYYANETDYQKAVEKTKLEQKKNQLGLNLGTIRNTDNWLTSDVLKDDVTGDVKLRCSNDLNCPLGMACSNGTCQVSQCKYDGDCSSNVCVNTPNYYPPYYCKVVPPGKLDSEVYKRYSKVNPMYWYN